MKPWLFFIKTFIIDWDFDLELEENELDDSPFEEDIFFNLKL
jgi:hypothetical protein